MDREDDVLVNLLVHRQFSGLAEGTGAALVVALEWFLLCVDVRVLLQVLSEGERLEAQDADVLLYRGVGGDVSPKRETCGVGLVACCDFAFVWSFHYKWVSV